MVRENVQIHLLVVEVNSLRSRMEAGFDEQEGPTNQEPSSPSTPPWVKELLREAMAAEEEEVKFNKPHRMLASISRAPRSMHRVVHHRDECVPIYEPGIVSIGPFHHHNPSVQSMEEHKRRLLISRINRLCPASRSTFLACLAASMKTLEARTRDCYSEAFDIMSSDEFVSMMVLDGCFILELFRISLRLENFTDEDSLLSTRWMRSALAFDLLKLENQLPYFVLEELYLLTKSGEDEACLMFLAQKFLYRFCRSKMHDNKGMVPFYRELSGLKPDHLLSLFYYMFMPGDSSNIISMTTLDGMQGRSLYFPPILPCVSDLLLSGIKIERGEEGSPMNIKYSRGKLAIPHFVVTKNSNIVLGNLIAYEQCNPRAPSYYTSYAMFLDEIMNSKKDIEALRIAGVLSNFLGTDGEVIELFNNLASGIDYFDVSKSYLFSLAVEVRRHCDRPWIRWKLRLRRLAASHEGMTCVITFFALYLGLLQTVFTVLSYARTCS